jgi:serine/threonine protein kinase
LALAPGTRIRTCDTVGALGADRLARFSREAQVLASLNHPKIAHIHGCEDHVGDTQGDHPEALMA